VDSVRWGFDGFVLCRDCWPGTYWGLPLTPGVTVLILFYYYVYGGAGCLQSMAARHHIHVPPSVVRSSWAFYHELVFMAGVSAGCLVISCGTPFSSLDTLLFAAGNGKSSGPLEPLSSCAFHGPGWRPQQSPRGDSFFSRNSWSSCERGRIVSGKRENSLNGMLKIASYQESEDNSNQGVNCPLDFRVT